uniref:dual specificity tyrosine-phosphorylation-regulated kinase 2-like n=1 Tax=Doryrhamphus excisus TaxID=161450 RepID=UPI0025ADCD59|nr:dual specificity tyrosine-phosphorylation-regulated kinase 2-like [Doryrhamphus excisus]
MSPELLLGKTSSPATDMWSLGCMLAELDRGYALFGSPDSDPSKQHKNTLAMRIRSSNPKFLDFIMSCLEYDAKKRLTPEHALRHPWILNTDAAKPVKSAIKMSVKAAKNSLLKREKIPPPLLQPLTQHK